MSSMSSMGAHGMLVVGTGPIYLSHLAMFMSPHDFQVVLEVELDEEATRAYRDSGPRPGSEIYTFLPERLPLEDLDPHAAHPRTSFKGILFRGHFERGGSVLQENVTVTITGAPHFRRFEPHAPDLPELQYFTFGKGGQLYLAHLVTRPPDFDQVLTVQIPDREDAAGDTLAGEAFTVAARGNTVDQRVKAGETVSGVLGGPHGGTKVSVVAGMELYLETGDLS